MNRDDLIGPNLPTQRTYLAFQKEFPGEGDELVVLAESGHTERTRQFIERLAARIRTHSDLFTDLFYKADLQTLGPKGLQLASTNDLEQLRHHLEEYRPLIEQFAQATNLDSLFAQINRQFRTAGSGSSKQGETLAQAIPFLQGIVSQAMQASLRAGHPPPPEIETLLTGGPEALSQIYITINQGRAFLLTVRPAKESVTGEAIQSLRQLMQATQLEVPGVDVGLTGGPVLDYDEMQLAQSDTIRASIVALTLCSGLFIAAYRQIGRPLKAALCLLVGLGYTLGFTTLTVGHLNILSITFAPMLIGLAIDFGIHFISRYEEEMRNRNPTKIAIERATTYTGQGIVVGGFTTAVAFLAMALTHFRGIREMGVISGGGLLLCLLPMMTALPVLLMHGRHNHRDHQLGPVGQRRLQIEFLWLKHPRIVLSTALLLCGISGWSARRIYFDYDLLHMQSQRLPSVIYEKKLVSSAGGYSLYGAVVADSLAQAREYEARLRHLSSVAEVHSAADLLTVETDQKLALVRAIESELRGIQLPPIDRAPIRIEPLSATLWYLTGYLGLASSAAQPYEPALANQLAALRNSLTRLRVIILRPNPEIRVQLTEFQREFFKNLHETLNVLREQEANSPLRVQDLPIALRNRFVGITGKFLVQVFPRKDIWEHQNQREFIRQLQSAVPPQRVTGTPVELYEYTTLLKTSYEQAACYALGAIVLMVLLHFRSLLFLLLALLPVGVGTLWLLGLMGWLGIRFNPANIMTLPLVVGIGVTNGVQILNRYAEERQPAVLAKSTGKAVLISGLTAIIGFGSLILASHQGIRSLGIVMSAGIAFCMVAALTTLPALLRIIMHRGLLETEFPGTVNQ